MSHTRGRVGVVKVQPGVAPIVVDKDMFGSWDCRGRGRRDYLGMCFHLSTHDLGCAGWLIL